MSENRNSFIEATKATDERLEALKQLYPELFSDGKINLDVLKEITGGENPQEERTPGYYGLYWPGKRKAKIEAKASPKGTLVPVPGDGVNEDTTHNIYIEGDNLEVLRILKQSYKGRVKMIYIDPPYNTGNDFIYPDDYTMPVEEYKRLTGQTDEKGNALTTNQKSNGAFHTKWLNMMFPRLMLARELLTDDGAIFISIDDNEHTNLKLLCDEIFGEENFVTSLIWSAGRKNDSKYISVSHEYILCYFKNSTFISENEITWRERKNGLDDIYAEYDKLKKDYGNDTKTIESELKDWYKNLPNGHPAKDHSHYNHVDEKGIFFPDNISWPGGGGPKYDVLHPVTNKPVKIPSRGWLTNEENMKNWIKQGKVQFGEDENGVPTLKSYLKDREYSVPYSVFYKDGRAASKRLATLMGDKLFENPKDEEIIQRIIGFVGLNNNDIVLDFFSGSATTAHSVFLANVVQEKKRKFVLVQLPEIIDEKNAKSEKSKKVAQNAIKLLDSLNKPHNICEIGKERIRRAGKEIFSTSADKSLDIGFKVYRMQESNFKEYTPVQGQDENATKSLFEELENNQIPLVDGWKTENVLTEIILKQGFALDCDCKKVDAFTKNTVYCIKDSKGPASRTTTMYVCLDSQIDSDTIKNLKLDEKEKFVCLNSAIDDTSYARLADKGRIETI